MLWGLVPMLQGLLCDHSPFQVRRAGPAIVPVDHSKRPGFPPLSPLSELSGVEDKGSYTAKLQILPQATKFISKKKFLSASAERQSTSLIKDNKSVT